MTKLKSKTHLKKKEKKEGQLSFSSLNQSYYV